MNLSNIELGILGPAFLAGLLVLSTHVPLGLQVLARGIVFIDLAIAQVAGIGVIVADGIGWEPLGWRVQVAACTAALLAAVLLTWTEKIWPQVQEALIGVLFVTAASVELLLLANNPHGSEHLQNLLVGQILWVTPSRLIPVAMLYAMVLACWFGIRERIGQLGFYVLFAITVTQSVQLVGIYLVFTSLIVPALAAHRFEPNIRLAVGYTTGAIGYVIGLMVSAEFDLPTGAVIVCSLVAAFLCSQIVAARRNRVIVPRTARNG